MQIRKTNREKGLAVGAAFSRQVRHSLYSHTKHPRGTKKGCFLRQCFHRLEKYNQALTRTVIEGNLMDQFDLSLEELNE